MSIELFETTLANYKDHWTEVCRDRNQNNQIWVTRYEGNCKTLKLKYHFPFHSQHTIIIPGSFEICCL